MDLSRIGSGVYRIVIAGREDQLVSGKLFHVIQLAKELSAEYTLQYLVEVEGELTWRQVNVEDHHHYHGDQSKLLLQWFYSLRCALSKFGYKRFEMITGVSAGRIQDAMRRADTVSHKPLSTQAILYIEYKVKQYLEDERNRANEELSA
ncbi:hypothetical protein [Cellvibrio sp. QJXJ]|uniref:hypothetical protein n=1 Tax=Cellvibrio sp. QJXJ TaxID=2964606 RepID=UPI0021C38CCE|nr:hypothetical protein [Cellvibrio sp. QJXJ]UUA75174.1 hypothetical protein NNX04_22210 [Cellvibrio sp. QJXJ]